MHLDTVIDEDVQRKRELSKRRELKAFSERVRKAVSEMERALKERLTVLRSDLESTTDDLKVASAQGDRSENAEYTNAVEKIARLTSDIAGIIEQLDELSTVNEASYAPIGRVVMYSTVLLSYWRSETSEREQITFKVYPGNISDIERGVLAKNSPVGKQVWLRGEGAQFTLLNRRTGKPVRYRIDMIY